MKPSRIRVTIESLAVTSMSTIDPASLRRAIEAELLELLSTVPDGSTPEMDGEELPQCIMLDSAESSGGAIGGAVARAIQVHIDHAVPSSPAAAPHTDVSP